MVLPEKTAPFELESRRQKGKRVKRTDETKTSWLIECVTRQSIEGEPRKFRWHEMSQEMHSQSQLDCECVRSKQ